MQKIQSTNSWHFLPLQPLSPVLPLRNSDRKAVGYGKFQATVFRIPLICSEHIMVHTTYYYQYTDSIPELHQAFNACSQFAGESETTSKPTPAQVGAAIKLPKDTTYADLFK